MEILALLAGPAAAGASKALSALAAAAGGFGILFSLASVAAAHRLWGRRSRQAGTGGPLPPVTVLKPIKGLDREMYENLASFLAQDYPRFQVLFCLQSPEDPALAVLQKLRADFPEADMGVVVSGGRIGYNPKVNNLSNAAPFIRHPMLLISDSDVRVDVDFLRRVVAPISDPRVGLVTCFYQSRGARSLGAALEALSVNAQFLPQAAVAAALGGMRFALGAVMLVPRSVFEECGGFLNLSHHLADDYCLGAAVQATGRRIAFAGPVVVTVPDSWSLGPHLAHLVRWARTIRVCQPAGFLGTILLHGLPLLLLDIAWNRPSATNIGLTAILVAARCAATAWIQLAYLRNREFLRHLPLLPVADVVSFLAWLAGWRSRTVVWRGVSYSIQTSGRLVPQAAERGRLGALAA